MIDIGLQEYYYNYSETRHLDGLYVSWISEENDDPYYGSTQPGEIWFLDCYCDLRMMELK